MRNAIVVPIATHLKGEYLIQFIATTVCKTVSLRGVVANIIVLFTVLKEEDQCHFDVSQDIANNQLIIEDSK